MKVYANLHIIIVIVIINAISYCVIIYYYDGKVVQSLSFKIE